MRCCACRLDEYRRSHVEAELRAVSKELLGTVDALLAKEPESEDTAPSRVFYLKMKVRGRVGSHTYGAGSVTHNPCAGGLQPLHRRD